jgi:ABC-type transport system involved in multi-copper enzyme maturation permease subunit
MTLRRRQLATVIRLELRRTLFGRRALWVYVLAFAPAVVIGLHSLDAVISRRPDALDEDTEILARIFQIYYLRLGIFFGCLGVFTRLFRGDMMERSLHHYLLTPLRRELLACGKFLAGAIATALIFGAAAVASFGLMYVHHGGAAIDYLLRQHGLGHLGGYLLVTVLACLGYGALFLLLGLLARNPILPAVAVLLWESVNHVLPASLKLVSVIFYLEPLLPVEVSAGGLAALFTVPAEPIAPALAIPGLLLVSALILGGACLRVRHTEIEYGE